MYGPNRAGNGEKERLLGKPSSHAEKSQLLVDGASSHEAKEQLNLHSYANVNLSLYDEHKQGKRAVHPTT